MDEMAMIHGLGCQIDLSQWSTSRFKRRLLWASNTSTAASEPDTMPDLEKVPASTSHAGTTRSGLHRQYAM